LSDFESARADQPLRFPDGLDHLPITGNDPEDFKSVGEVIKRWSLEGEKSPKWSQANTDATLQVNLEWMGSKAKVLALPTTITPPP